MSLVEQYNEEGGLVNAKLVAAFSKSAADMILTLDITTDPDWKQKVKFAEYLLSSDSKDIRWIARAIISQGYDSTTPDGTLQAIANSNFDKLAIIYNENL